MQKESFSSGFDAFLGGFSAQRRFLLLINSKMEAE